MRRKDVLSGVLLVVIGLVLIFIAGIFLAHNYDVMRLRDSWPLFIVGAGLSVLLNVAAGRPNRNERKPS